MQLFGTKMCPQPLNDQLKSLWDDTDHPLLFRQNYGAKIITTQSYLQVN